MCFSEKIEEECVPCLEEREIGMNRVEKGRAGKGTVY
jgi:hypothetical protein